MEESPIAPFLTQVRGTGTKNKLGQTRRRVRYAKGVEGWGYHLPIRIGGLGERRDQTTYSSDSEPRHKTNVVHSDVCRKPLVVKIQVIL